MKASKTDIDKIQKRVIELIAEQLNTTPDELSIDSKLSDIGMDSMDLMDLAFDLEDSFGILDSDLEEKIVPDMEIREVVCLVEKTIKEEAAKKKDDCKQ